MKISHFVSAMIIGVASAVLGCGGEERPAGMPSLYPVKIKVVQDGSPLDGASVQLVPQDATNKWASGGSTDASGEVKIMTMGRYEGAPAGTYKVTIDKVISDGPAIVMDDPGGNPPSTAYRLVDPRYNVADTTTAEIIVAEGRLTEETIDVGATVKKELPALE